MIVYNLACHQHHPFEGWFSSPIDFENQCDKGLVECPVCGSKQVERRLHAPRINLGASPVSKSQAVESAAQRDGEIVRDKLANAIAGFVKGVRENTEYVGERFAEEARAMHYGEKPLKGIRGQADKETAEALRDEGIDVQQLPFPVDFPTAH